MSKPRRIKKSQDCKNAVELSQALNESGLIPTAKAIAQNYLPNTKPDKDLYHNTALLLEKYLDIIWILESFCTEVATELNEPVQDLDKIIERLSHEITLEPSVYLDRLNSVTKSRQLIEAVHRAMMVLKSKPRNGERMYYAIYYRYFYKERLSVDEILQKLQEHDRYNERISERTYYYIKKDAIELLSLCLWRKPDAEQNSMSNLPALLERI